MADAGRLVLVVGPSGAGKDSLIAGARAVLTGDERFVFPRRVVTRNSVAELEDHDSVSREVFAAARAAGAYALDWEAHGLCYGLPAALEADIAEGKVVVTNISRKVIPAAMAKYPRTMVIFVTADLALRAARLASRGRESADDVALRLAREGASLPKDVEPVIIDNSGSLDMGVALFVAALDSIANAPR